MNRPVYLFHYTSEARVKDIIESGELKVSKAALHRNEKPALWLSSEPIWDESATKFLNFSSKENQFRHIGLGRIVVPFEHHFVTYAKWRHVSGVAPLLASKESLLFNSYDRSKWWASFQSIPESDFLSVEYWDGETWCDYFEKGTPTVFNVRFANNNL